MVNTDVKINCDVGEGVDNEASLLPLIDYCSIACGGHAGDIETMQRVLTIAEESEVKVGAHPSYPDKENFGRKTMTISSEALIESIRNQLETFDRALGQSDKPLTHIKLHGALYNDAVVSRRIADTVWKALELNYKNIPLMLPFRSELGKIARENRHPCIYEAFGDRNYNADLTLVNRSSPNALIHDEEEVYQHILRMATERRVKTVEGELVPLQAETWCIHSDTENAVTIVGYIRNKLKNTRLG
ncbi:5-oxoprolinase subunit PxpA [Robertkochia aurantiaca]|uniref:5-oxoprolinase subunit PxpA n=1 Tax=Robertkochia aurantiaca TaxID=2873700 RepID=UPI001CC9E6E9|nr:5-oxoprolinase subunit PxpA [Robertkochia sp. 3YJGBD-33]